jgi:hypothetical protein
MALRRDATTTALTTQSTSLAGLAATAVMLSLGISLGVAAMLVGFSVLFGG